MKLRVDTIGDVPTDAERIEYGIDTLSVKPDANGSGGPELTLEFVATGSGFDAQTAEQNARRFIKDWMRSQDVDGDMEVALDVG